MAVAAYRAILSPQKSGWNGTKTKANDGTLRITNM